MLVRRQAAWLGLAVGVSITSWMAAAWAQTDWYLLKSSGETIGQIRINRYQKQNGKISSAITEVSHINRMQREGTPFEVSMVSRFEENPVDGKPIKFSYQYQLNQQTWVDASGDIENNDLNLQLLQQDQSAKAKFTIAPKEAFMFPDGPAIQKIYREHAKDPLGSKFCFQTMHLGLSPKVVDAHVTLLSLDEMKLADGSAKKMRKFEVQNPLNPSTSIYEWRDDAGKLYKAQASDNGMEMVYASRQEVRLSKPPATDAMAHGIPVNTFVVNPREVYQATYQIKPKKGQALTGLSSIPSNDRQQVQTTGNGIRVTVSRKEAMNTSERLPIQASLALQPYFQSSAYIQANDAEIQRIARKVTAGQEQAGIAAELLRQWVYQNITNKNYDTAFAGAKQTLLSRSGDCTEHAVLLASLTRAIGVPSRIAVGLLYLPDTNQSGRFVYHMWTEIWLGKPGKGVWVPLDAAQPEAVVDVGRIKLADSALNSEEDLIHLTQPIAQWMGQIQINVFQALTPGQSVLSLNNNLNVLKLDITAQDKQPMSSLDIQQVRKKHFLRVGAIPPPLLPDAPEALFTQGVEQLNKRDTDSATKTFEKVIQQTDNPLALYRLGERLISVKMFPLALNAFHQAESKEPRLSALVSEWENEIQKAQNATDLGSLEATGDSWLDKEDFAQAKNYYAQAQTAMANHSKAWLGFRLKQIEGKQKLASGAAILKKNQRNANGWLLVGQGLQACVDLEEAKKAFQNAEKLQPNTSEAWIGLFSIAVNTADWEFIDRNQARLEQFKNTHGEAAKLLGLIQMKRRHYSEAIQLLQTARQLAPRNPSVFLSLADLYERMPVYEENIGKTPQTTLWAQRAENVLKAGIAAMPEQSELRLRLGKILLPERKPALALAEAAQILAQDPLNEKAYVLAGTAKLHQNNLADAETFLKNAQILEPYDADALATLGYVFHEKGDEAKAIQLYRQACQLDSTNPLAIAALLQSNAVGIKSSLKIPLNEDEKDYLVQAIWMRRQMLLNTRSALQGMKQLLEEYGPPEFSVNSLSLFKETDILNTQSIARENVIYQTISAMKPPQRFAQFHAQLLSLSASSLKSYEETGLSGFYSKKEIEEELQLRQAYQNELIDKMKAFMVAQEELRTQIPKVTHDMITLESRWDEQALLLEEVVSLIKEISAKSTVEKSKAQELKKH